MPTAPEARFVFETGDHASDVIDEAMFGANTLLGRDDLTGTYHDKIQHMGVTLLRYPGGALAEDYFDLTDPDAEMMTPVANYVGLTDFLTYTHTHGIVPAIVIPTKRYQADPAAGEAEIRSFVEAVTRGDYGPVDEVMFQVGNEFYATTANYGPLSASEYGALASRFAVAIEDASLLPATVTIQTGRNTSDNDTIISAFDTATEKAAVSGVSVHQYPWNFDAIEGRFDDVEDLLEAWDTHGVDAIAFMSEWNIGSSGDATLDDRHDYGLAQNVALIELVNQAILAGIDVAAIWGIQQNNKTSLGANEGSSDIYAAGELFRLMAEAIPGTQALVEAARVSGDGSVVTYGYESADQITIFVAARDIDLAYGPVKIGIDLDGLAPGFASVTADSITTLDDPDQYRPTPTLTTYTPDLVIENGEPIVEISLTQDYEVVRLTFVKPDAIVTDETRIGGVSDDILAGGGGNDTIKGHGGADYLQAHGGDDDIRGGRMGDQIEGGGGNDTILGGGASDRLEGGSGADHISGGSGRDTIDGGSGADQLYGQVGRDFIYGGSGNDTIDGGIGNDRLWGGEGDDHFTFTGTWGFDRVQDFTIGEDIIDLSSVGSVSSYSDMASTMTQTGTGVLISLTEGSIYLRNLLVTELSSDEFVF